MYPRQRRLHQLRLPDARAMRGQCDGNRRILRAERELFGIRRRPGAQAHQLAALPRSGSHSNVKSENGMVWPFPALPGNQTGKGGIKLFAMPIDRVSGAPFSTSRRDGDIALSRSSSERWLLDPTTTANLTPLQKDAA